MHKYGLKVLGLALAAALGLMAFSASAAFAVSLNLGDEPYGVEVGEFLTNSGTLFPTGLNTQVVKGKQIGTGTLLIPGKSAEINCTEGEITSATIANEHQNFKTGVMKVGGHGVGTVLFKGCTVLEINAAGELVLEAGVPKELKKCTEELNKPTSPAGQHHITAKVLLMVKRHEGKTYLLAYPEITSLATAEAAEALTAAFTTLTFGGTCSLPETVKVTGSLAASAPVADAVKPVIKIDSFSAAGKAEQALLGTKLKFGANEAFIKGEAEAELPNNAGVPWGAM